MDDMEEEVPTEQVVPERTVFGEILYGMFLGALPYALPFMLLMLIAGPHL